MEIQDAIDRCLDDLSLAPKTVTAYTVGLLRFVEYLDEGGLTNHSPIEKLTIEHFIYFLPWLDRQYCRQTSNLYGVAAGALLDWLVTAGIIEMNYKDTLRYQSAKRKSHRRRETKLPRWPQKDDVANILKAVHECNEKSPARERNIALLEFLASTGCRNNEAVQLKVGNINLQERTTIVMGKGSKERRVFFNKATADAIAEYWKVRGSAKRDDPVFARHDKRAGRKELKPMSTDTPRNIVKAMMIPAGIERLKFSPHYFRHAFAMSVLEETGNLALTQDLLGHDDPKSTRVYAKINSEDLKKGYRKVFG